MSAKRAAFAAAPAVILMASLLPVMSGRETWFFRDLFNYHLTVKVAQATAMRDGFLPLVDPLRAGGQALVGNLNNVALYPDNLLYLVAPTPWALNAHLWLHLLLAVCAAYWLGRAWGLAREAAWASGFCYALSGFFLSQLNLYNLIAGTALAPAFGAACIAAVRGRRPALAGAAAGAAWALILLGGDPILAAMALLAGVAAVLFGAERRARDLLRLALCVGLGTLVAAPQLVELQRVLSGSYRGAVGLNVQSRLAASWDPRTIVEMLVPLFFGPPDQRYWGEIVLRTMRPFYLSLYPGLVAAALVLAAGRPRARATAWAWTLVGVGLFFALGGWNPLTYYLYSLPYADSLRYPIKAWILIALGASVLAGAGFQRAVLDGTPRPLLRWLSIGGALAAGAWLALTVGDAAAVTWLRSRIGRFFPPSLAADEVGRWRQALLLSLVTVVLAAVLARMSPRSPRLAGSALVALHVGSQILLLRPLLQSDDAAAYRGPPAALAHLQPGERVAHGCSFELACERGRLGTYPGPEAWWRQRRGWVELHPYAGAGYGVRYAFNTSPDGLDSMLAFIGNRALRDLDDAEAIRLLAGSAVDVLLVSREIEPRAARDLLRLRGRLPSLGGELFVYEIRQRAEEVRLASRVESGEPERVLHAILAPDFDPRRDAFVPGPSRSLEELAGGEAVVLGESWEHLRIETVSSGDGMLVLGRAWLPLYRATVDGAPTTTIQANMGQLAVPVPAGRHRVEIQVDRSPFRAALAASATGLLGLAAVAFAGGVRRQPVPEATSTCQTSGGGGESAGSTERSAAASV